MLAFYIKVKSLFLVSHALFINKTTTKSKHDHEKNYSKRLMHHNIDDIDEKSRPFTSFSVRTN